MKKIFCLIFSVIFLLCLGSCKNQEPNKLPVSSDVSEASLLEEKIEELLGSMTLEEKIAQMLIVEVKNGQNLSSPVPGGIILFEENFTSCQKTYDFINGLKAQSEHPLIVSVDQEGGSVQRLKSLHSPKATNIPSMYSLGKTEDCLLAYETGRVMAEEMGALGINVAFAPVLDIYSNPNNKVIGKRSFSENPHTVSDMAINLAKGMEESGVIPTYKHFPGHGDTATDSHIKLPIIRKTKAELYSQELIPFERAINNGAKIIMVGHIALPEITGDNTPATLSKEIITNLLIKEMGFEGLIVTDALNMGALIKNYSQEEIYKMTVGAGTDLLLMPQNPDLAIKVIKENFTEERINASVKKILYFKYKYLSVSVQYDIISIGSAEHKATVDRIK